ncbi:MAG: oligosaccharide flippase family protein [Desulfobacterales bacterium]|nr:oligosaccharide flippase family protein [Desulfobacterales bacterium]
MPSLLKSSLTYAPSIIVPRIFSYIIVIVFTRLLSPAEFGLYSLVITYGEVLDSVFMNWSRLGMIRFLRNDDSANTGGLIKANLYLYGISIIAGLSGAALLSLLTGNSTSPPLFFLALTIYFIGNSSMRFGLTILRALEKQKLYTILEVIRPSLSFGCIFLALPFFGLSYKSLAFGFFGFTAFFGLGTLIWTTRNYHRSPVNWQTLRQMILFALPLVLMFFLRSIIKATDRFMINAFSGAAIVGLYAASYSLSRPPFELLSNAINLGAFPKLVNLYENKGSQSAAAHLAHIITIQIYWGLPMVAGITILAQPLANIMLGEEFRQGATILMPLMAMTGLFAGLKAFAYDQVFHLKKCPMILTYTLLPAAILNIILNYFFILSFGAYGVAWATLLSYLLALLLSFLLSTRLIQVPFPYKEARTAFFSSFFMWLGLSIISLNIQDQNLLQIILAIPSGIIIYFLFSLLLGSQTTKNILKRILLKGVPHP